MLYFIFAIITYVLLQMLLTWAIAIKINNPSLIDVAWPFTITVIGLANQCYYWHSWLNTALTLVILFWGARLTTYLFFTRVAKAKVDKRYLSLQEAWQNNLNLKLLLNYLLQGVLLLIISTPLFFIAHIQSLSLWFILGSILCIIATCTEHVADMQLYRFSKRGSKGVCNIGLWQYSRHPNYFFEWLVWVGFSLTAVTVSLGWIAFISPLLLYLIMTKITGPMTESGSIQSRGQAYIDYQQRVPMFFPRLKKSETS